MSVRLEKGASVSLQKLVRGSLSRIRVSCGWSAEAGYDLDVSAVGLLHTGKMPDRKFNSDGQRRHEWFVWANMRSDPYGAIRFLYDNRTGGGQEEQMTVDVTKVPTEIERIRFQVVIWRAKYRQTFGRVKNAYIRINDERTGAELARFNLGADFRRDTLVMFGELYRESGEWKFRAVGEGCSPRSFRRRFGVQNHLESECARYSH